MPGPDPRLEPELLAAAQRGDSAAFDRLLAPYRRELYAHCYRMLGSLQDAEDALQESLLGAWKGLAPFEARSSLRSWLYKIATNACLRLIAQRPRRMLSPEHGPARSDVFDLGQPVLDPIWLEPWVETQPADPSANPFATALQRESLELAFVAALQYLPGLQRAVLLLAEVLEFSAAEIAEQLDSSVPAVNSALQRARKTLAERGPSRSQQSELNTLAAAEQRALVDDFLGAWHGQDLEALLSLLTEDVRFIMPPLPAWFDGRRDVGRFFAERVFAMPWRLVSLRVNTQLGFACYSGPPGTSELRLSAVNLLCLRAGKIAEIDAFLDAPLLNRLSLPAAL